MSLNKSAIITGLALVGLILSSPGCEGPATYVLPEGSPPMGGEPVPSLLSASLSSNNSVLIRDDATEGSAVLTVESSRESTFTWIIDAPEGLLDVCVGPADDCIPLPDDGTDTHTGIRGWLRILGVLSDPGPTGTEVRITVVVTEVLELPEDGEAEVEPESTEQKMVLTVVRPESELAVSISSGSGRIAPHDTVILTANISGGTPFVGGSTCGTAVEDNEVNPPDPDPPYCITWTLDESGLIVDGWTGGTFSLDALTTGENGETLSSVTYVAPLAVGNVSFRVDVTDQRGNRATAMLAIPVTSKRELAIAEGTAASIDVAPGRSVELSATASGGEAPYKITFEILGGDNAIGTLVPMPAVCSGLEEGQKCTADYVAPDDTVGPVQVRVTIEDAVGATSSMIIPLTLDSPEPLTVDLNTPSAVQPNSTTQIRADVAGGTPPYTVCFGFQDTPLGTIATASSDCSPDTDNDFLAGFTLCTCNVGDLSTDGLVTETVERNYKAPRDDGDVRLEVRVTDATGANASATEGVNIASTAGGSGTGGGGTVSLGASVNHPALCMVPLPDPQETATITATASGGSGNNTFTFALTGAGPSDDSLAQSGNTATYYASRTQALPRTIKVTVTETGGSSAEATVQITTTNPAVCVDADECTQDNVCLLGACQFPAVPDNGPCADDGNDCTEDVCIGGVCTHSDLPAGTACGNPADTECDEPDTCDGAGVCLANYELVGTACGNGDDTDCTNPDACDGAGSCLDNHEADGTGCTDDGNDCTGDVCSAGACTHPNLPPLTACGDPSNTICTNPDTCNGLGVCLANHAADGTACPDDGNDCTADVCAAGACTHPNLPAGTACGDPSVDDCDAANTCDGAGTCLDNPVQDGDPCTDDGNDCTNDICMSGVCTHPDWPAGWACGDPTDTECDDPDTCNGTGTCLPNYESAGTACGDPTNNDCTDPDTCDGGGFCLDNHESDGMSCTDEGNDCTDDVCSAGICTHPNLPPGMACGDPSNTVCTNPDTCNGAGVCLPNDAAAGTACGDPTDNDCTNPDTCDGAGACLDNHETNGTACTDDGNDCTDDVCNTGVCEHPDKPSGTACGDPTDTECDDPDTCNGAGTCLANYELAGTVCGDPSDNDCTDPDTCDGAGACLDNHEADGTACTDDGTECTDDVCSAGVCTHPNEPFGTACGDSGNSQCSDPDICDGAGNCDPRHEAAGTPCGSQGSSECDDPNSCDGNGVCSDNYWPAGTACGDPSDTDCDNPDTCDGAGTCDPNDEPDGTACTDDGNDCTDDICESAICIHPDEPAGTPCGDPTDDDCTDPDTCDGAGVCLDNDEADGTGCTDDGNDCTDDVCNAGLCTHPNSPAGSACGDPTDDDCTDPDTCDGAGVCEPNDELVGTACGDQSDTDCTDPDTCDGTGICLDNHEVPGTSCGDPSNTVCTDPDICDGAGNCDPRDEAAGTPCGDPSDTDCTDPDTCDGVGTCDPNHEPDGTPCTDCDTPPCTTCLAGECQGQ